MPVQQENTYLTPESRGRDLTDATNFSRFQEIHNAPEKRPTCPDSSVKHRKRRDNFNPENVKVPPFKLEFVDSDDDHSAAMKDIRKDYASFTSKIMNVEIGDNMLPSSSGMQMRIWMKWARRLQGQPDSHEHEFWDYKWMLDALPWHQKKLVSIAYCINNVRTPHLCDVFGYCINWTYSPTHSPYSHIVFALLDQWSSLIALKSILCYFAIFFTPAHFALIGQIEILFFPLSSHSV